MTKVQQPDEGRDAALERALVELGRRVEYPPSPDLASTVTDALTAPAAAARRGGAGWLVSTGLRPFARALLLALLTLLLVVGTILAVGLGLRGLGIAFVDELPPVPDELRLGERVTLADAQARVAYRIVLPAAELGAPEVFVDELGPTKQVSLVYRRDGEVAVLLTQFEASADQSLAQKLLGPGTTIEVLTVAGDAAFWIDGEPHALLYRDLSGGVIEDRVRLVGNVLMWQQGQLTLRLEGVDSKAEALHIAGSVD